MGIVETIVGALINLMAGWLGKRQAAKAQKKADDKQTADEAVATAVVHQTDIQVEQDRAHDEAATDQVRADGPDVHGVGGSLRKQSDDNAAALAAAEHRVR